MSVEIIDDIAGQWQNDQWFSEVRLAGAPLRWAFSALENAYHLAYITFEELDILKSKFSNQIVFEGPYKIGYLGTRKIDNNIVVNTNRTVQAPLFWKSDKLHPMALLMYLTNDHADLLKKIDIYKSNIAVNPHYGPEGIPSYQGDGGDGGDGGAADGGGVGSCPATGCSVGDPGGPADFGPIAAEGGGFLQFRSNSGVYSGSLSAQGHMVAMQLNNGAKRPSTVSTESSPSYEPYLWGYFMQYWEDPTKCTFGANSAIPALTCVVPQKYADLTVPMTGSLVYYIDLSMCRLLGFANNQPAFPDQFQFVTSFNQIVAWVQTSNDYIASINNSEDKNLSYYGSNNYKDYITKGFDIFTQGSALIRAFKNIGILIQTVSSGYFGTANAVAKSMLDNGLGFVGNLYDNLVSQGVDLNSIYNPSYTRIIENVLRNITSPADLINIQGVLETKVKNFKSPLDYTSIEIVSGLPNDSKFTNMAEVGRQLYSLAPDLVYQTGDGLARLLERIVVDTGANLTISTTTSSLTPEIISSLRSFLPQTADNETVSVLNLVGAASGYLTSYLKLVNDAIAALYATSYGPQIRAALENISQSYSELALNQNEENSAIRNTTYWIERQSSSVQAYYNLLQTIVSDTSADISYLVRTINENYDFVCQQLYFEINNYNKANIALGIYQDNSILFNFVQSLPFYGADPTNIGTDALLYGLAAPNQGGELVKAILADAKNNQLLGEAGIRVRTL